MEYSHAVFRCGSWTMLYPVSVRRALSGATSVKLHGVASIKLTPASRVCVCTGRAIDEMGDIVRRPGQVSRRLPAARMLIVLPASNLTTLTMWRPARMRPLQLMLPVLAFVCRAPPIPLVRRTRMDRARCRRLHWW
jgi:hypothetical protein